MDFIPNEIELALQIADNMDNIADNGISYKQLTLSGDVLLQCHNKTVIALGELNSVVLPYLKTHKPDIYSIVKKNRDSLLRDMREVKEIAEQGNKMQWPDKVQNSLRTLAKALRASSDNAGDNMQAISKTTKRKVEAIRDQVFICYSHKDKRWLEDLQIHLKPYVRNGSVTAWSDKQIAPGSKWLPEIKVALAHTKVAALLVTPYFLASDFIHENELTPLLKEAEKGDVRIIWIPVRACAYKETPLKDYQGAIDADKPLANMKADRDKAWVKICEEIKKAVNR